MIAHINNPIPLIILGLCCVFIVWLIIHTLSELRRDIRYIKEDVERLEKGSIREEVHGRHKP